MSEILLVDTPDDPEANFRLNRLLEWADVPTAAITRAQIDAGTLQSAAWQAACRAARVVVPMGPAATQLLGIQGHMLEVRGYIGPGPYATHIIPTVHPSFVQHGMAKWSAAFINDVQKALKLSREGLPPQPLSYVLDPSPLAALEWARRYRAELARDPRTRLAFDIETPGKDADEEDLDGDDAPDRTWNVERVGLSYAPLGALSVPFEPPYRAALNHALGSEGDKVVWNAGFDVPRLRRVGLGPLGVIHDGMVAWHILHSDLPKRLGFVATFTCPWQGAWKHLSSAKPAYYNAVDADVELRSMQVIEAELRKCNLWDVYQRDVLDLEPILVHMSAAGMPIDSEVRYDRAVKLATRLAEVTQSLIDATPIAARRISHVYAKQPADTTGLSSRPGTRLVHRCAACGLESPRKHHFRRLVKKVNPCADAGITSSREDTVEYYRLAPFTPSRHQLIRYHELIGRKLPTKWDPKAHCRRVSFAEEQLRGLILDYPRDIIYPLVLQYRSLDKLGGTYIGRPA